MERALGLAVAGGGTGGHVFPGLAIAREFRRRDEKARVLYIGVAGKMEEKVIPEAGMNFHGLKVRGLSGRGWKGAMSSLALAGRAFRECRRLLPGFGVDLMVGVGGYSSGPAAAAAWTLGIPLVLQEQNTIPGLTNRLLARLASRVFISFDPARRYFPRRKVVLTGNPVREEALAPLSEVGREKTLRVLVLGGSRGAGGVNRLATAALDHLSEVQGLLEFVHQSGGEDREWVESAYRSAGIRVEVQSFIQDIGEKYSWADLVISRSGAGTVSELSANGRPAVLVPFPRSAGGHQEVNARWLEERGGAVVVEEEEPEAPRRIAEIVKGLAHHRGRLREMAADSRRVGSRDAAARIVTECYSLLGISDPLRAS